MTCDRAIRPGRFPVTSHQWPHRARRLRVQFEGERSSYSTPRDFSFRWSAERSMPMNSAVRDMFPPNRLI